MHGESSRNCLLRLKASSTTQPAEIFLSPHAIQETWGYIHRGGSGAVHSRLVIGANTLSPTEVGALSVVAHPDIGQRLSLSPHLSGLALLPKSQLAIANHFNSFSFIHFLHLTPSFLSGTLLARKRMYSY